MFIQRSVRLTPGRTDCLKIIEQGKFSDTVGHGCVFSHACGKCGSMKGGAEQIYYGFVIYDYYHNMTPPSDICLDIFCKHMPEHML